MKSRVFLPALLSGGLLWTAFFPLDLGPVAYIAFVPFLTLVRTEGVGPWRRYFAAYLGGLFFHLLALQWVRVAHPMMEMFAWPGLSIFYALVWPLKLFLLRKVDRWKFPLAVTFPIVCVAVDYLQAHFPTGFPFLAWVHAYQPVGFGWYFLGYSQHRIITMIQVADLGGVYLVTAGVAAVNGAMYEWLLRSRLARRLLRWPTVARQPAAVRELWIFAYAAMLPLGFVIYGTYRLSHESLPLGPRIAALQGNLSQSEKMVRGDQKPENVQETPLEEEYVPLAEHAVLAEPSGRPPDLVIWPETCYPDNWFDTTPELAEQPNGEKLVQTVQLYQKDFLQTLHRRLTPSNMLLGLNRTEWLDDHTQRRFNSAILIRKDGTLGGQYDKMHLVPFGEYVPLRRWFPWLQRFTPYDHDYSCTPGERWTRFELPARKKIYHFGVLICYEDTDPTLARQYNPLSFRTEGVDFLINISNDGWFDGTEEHEEHLAVSRFRAIEARRSLVRAVNMGISAVIDSDGRVIALPAAESWSGSKAMRGIVRADVPIDDRDSIYAALGDWLPVLCWLVIVGALVQARRQRRAVTSERWV